MPSDRNHQSGENAEQRSLATAVRSEQPKQFRRMHIERNPVQRGTLTIAVKNFLHGNNRRRLFRCRFRLHRICLCSQKGPCVKTYNARLQQTYDETLSSIISANNNGKYSTVARNRWRARCFESGLSTGSRSVASRAE